MVDATRIRIVFWGHCPVILNRTGFQASAIVHQLVFNLDTYTQLKIVVKVKLISKAHTVNMTK